MKSRMLAVLLSLILGTIVAIPDGRLQVLAQSDNRAILFVAMGHIFSTNADGTNSKNLTPSIQNAVNPVGSPDGNQIAFNTEEILYVMNADGSDLKQLSDSKTLGARPIWSPDGKQIAFEWRDKLLTQDWQIGVIKPDGSNIRILTTRDSNREPAWSYDGTKLTFTSQRGDDTFELHTISADGSNETKLIGPLPLLESPSWSPDGNEIIFDGIDYQRRDIYSIKADGSDLKNLTKNLPGSSKLATWSPDGRYLAFKTDTDSKASQPVDVGLGLITLQGSDATVVSWSGNGRGFYFLAWSPNSQQIAFESNFSDPVLYTLHITCMFTLVGCEKEAVATLGGNIYLDGPAYLNWAYTPAIAHSMAN